MGWCWTKRAGLATYNDAKIFGIWITKSDRWEASGTPLDSDETSPRLLRGSAMG